MSQELHPVVSRLKREMDRRDISVLEMSRRLKKKTATGLYQMFRGEKIPNLKQLNKVAEALGLEIVAKKRPGSGKAA